MTSIWIWGGALGLYIFFLGWYQNWRGKLSSAEIDTYMQKMEAGGYEVATLSRMRAFLEADDGKEFVMLNLVRLYEGDVAHPKTGEMMSPRALLQGYLKGFLPALIKRGGHPALQARKVGPYVDSWNVEPDPEWTIMGYMRYRSRRDMMALATDARFMDAHPFKHAAIETTFSFPTQRMMALYFSPTIWVALVLALGGALSHLALLV